MSSRAVRDDIRASWSVRVPTIPYYDTLNTTPLTNGLPDVWATLLFSGEKGRITIGGSPACYREVGVIAVVLMTRSGKTDAAALAAAETITEAFRGYVGAGGRLQIAEVQPPDDSVNEVPPKTEFYKTIVELGYVLETYE